MLKHLYGNDPATLKYQQRRYAALDAAFSAEFGTGKRFYFSSPGRVELGGNHTDHNHGRVLAASISLDSIAAAALNRSNRVVIYSEGYTSPFKVDLAELASRANERETTQALIRGIAARFKELGYSIGGFNAQISSEVLSGSGLSSSASIEVLIGAIFNGLYNANRIAPQELATIGQYAENVYFGKPCGLMDQMACAVGGIIGIDFQDVAHPLVERIDFDFAASGHSLVMVDTGGSHADLTADYAAVPKEMQAVASALETTSLRDVNEEIFHARLSELRRLLGDRSILRAMHFFEENKRVSRQIEALNQNDFQGFLDLVRDSGNSSHKRLQNIVSPNSSKEQGLALALALSEDFLSTCETGACRVHGGGFAGTILSILPTSAIGYYRQKMEGVFGKGCVTELTIRNTGVFNIMSS